MRHLGAGAESMPSKNKAYVTGSRYSGYTLVIPAELPEPTRAEFTLLRGSWYSRYRAAQLLANAINADARRQVQK